MRVQKARAVGLVFAGAVFASSGFMMAQSVAAGDPESAPTAEPTQEAPEQLEGVFGPGDPQAPVTPVDPATIQKQLSANSIPARACPRVFEFLTRPEVAQHMREAFGYDASNLRFANGCPSLDEVRSDYGVKDPS